MREFLSIASALSDASRVRALLMLRDGELCVCQIIDLLDLSPSTVSRHMTMLYDAGLVQRRKEGRWHYYRLSTGDETPAVAQQALRWVLQSLGEDTAAHDVQLRVAEVRCKDIEEVCACYRK